MAGFQTTSSIFTICTRAQTTIEKCLCMRKTNVTLALKYVVAVMHATSVDFYPRIHTEILKWRMTVQCFVFRRKFFQQVRNGFSLLPLIALKTFPFSWYFLLLFRVMQLCWAKHFSSSVLYPTISENAEKMCYRLQSISFLFGHWQ